VGEIVEVEKVVLVVKKFFFLEFLKTNFVRKCNKTMKKDVRVQEVGHIFMPGFMFAKSTKISYKTIFQVKFIAFNNKINSFINLIAGKHITFILKVD